MYTPMLEREANGGVQKIYKFDNGYGASVINLQEHIEGFLSMRSYHRSGNLYQLIGKERRLLRRFGVVKVK